MWVPIVVEEVREITNNKNELVLVFVFFLFSEMLWVNIIYLTHT